MPTFAPTRPTSPRRRAHLGVLAVIAAVVVQVHVALLQGAQQQLATTSLVRAQPAIAVSVRSIPQSPASAPAIAPRMAAPLRERALAPTRVLRAPVEASNAAVATQLDAAGVLAHMPKEETAAAPGTEAKATGDSMPTYPTHVPATFTQVYELRRGALVGRAELNWRVQEQAYEAQLTGSLAGAPWLEWTSHGGFDTAGLAPVRYTDRRRGRAAQAANFQRAIVGESGKISYSGPAVEHPLHAGSQDRLSWIVQLAAIVRGGGVAPAITMFVSGARGDADVWIFDVGGVEVVETPMGGVNALKLVREPRRLYDTRAEIWLDPAREYLLVRLRLLNPPAGEALELLLREPEGIRP
jgi:hypothetical protein